MVCFCTVAKLLHYYTYSIFLLPSFVFNLATSITVPGSTSRWCFSSRLFYESPVLAVWRRGLTLLSCRRRAESRSPDRHHHPQTHPGKDNASPAPNRSAQTAATPRQSFRPPPPREQRDVGLHRDDNHVSSICQTRTPEKAAGA